MPSFLAKISSKDEISKRRMKFIHALVGGATIAILTLGAYIPAIQGGYIWDDDVYVTENALLTAPDGLRRIWFSLDSPSQYFPLVYTTFRIEHAIWGLNPMGYHIVNVCLHIINALFLWLILSRLGIRGSWLAAAIWALHPVNVESVAWITERKNTLSTLFYLLTVLAWLRFVDASGRRRYWYYGLSIILCQLALFAKTTACTLPAAMLLVVWLRGEKLKAGLSFIKRLIQVLPFVFQGVIMGLISIWWERFHQGTTGPEFSFTFVERILIASRAVWFYLGKLIFPSKLTFSYPKWEINVADPTQYVWLIGCLVVAVLLWLRRKHVGNGLVAGLVFFVAALFPTLGFFSLYTFRYTFVADHYQYLACTGPIAIISWLLTANWRKFSQAKNVVLASIIIVLWVLTWRQGHIYKDSETLWSDNLAKNPVSWMAYNNLAAVLLKQGDAEKSLEYHKKALEIYENPEAYIGLGAALTQLGRPQEAIPHLQRALKLRPNDPSTYYNMGIAFAAMGNTCKSIENYQKALEINPHYVKARNNLGSVLASQGNFKEAAEQYLNILNDNPNDDKAHTNLANVLAEVGKIDEAEQHYLYALTSNPNNETAHYNLARLYSAKGDLPNAIQHYREAIRLNPKNVNAHYNLACIYGMQNKLDKAIEEYRKAINLKPDFADAHKNLAVSLYFTSDYVGAWREVALAKKYGATPHPEFIKALSQKMPPP